MTHIKFILPLRYDEIVQKYKAAQVLGYVSKTFDGRQFLKKMAARQKDRNTINSLSGKIKV